MRVEQKNDLFVPDLPPVDAGGYLVAYLFEVGPVASSGMGVAPVPYQELVAWQQGVGLSLSPWEFRTLRMLSVEYVVESRLAESVDRAAPWVNPDSEEYRLRVLPQRIKSFLREK